MAANERKPRRARGTGSVRASKGRFEALAPGHPQRSLGSYDSEQQALDVLAAWLAEHAADEPAEPRERAQPSSDTQLTKALGRYLDGFRKYGPQRGSRRDVAIGALPGFPTSTSDPAVVDNAADTIAERLRSGPKLAAIAELRQRQRVLDLRNEADRLRAMSNHSAERAMFVREAAAWAAEHGISYEAFREYGVPADVLSDAGIAPSPKRK